MGLIEQRYSSVLEIGLELGKTCSALQLEDNCLTFARSEKYLKSIGETEKENVHVIIPESLKFAAIEILPDTITTHLVKKEDNIEYVFTYIHNEINKDRDPKPNVIGKNVNIHPTTVIGVHGNTYCVCPDGSKLNMKHMGNVVIEDNVDVEALCVVHRAGMTSTIIGEGSKVCVKVNFGHNCICGKRNFIAPGVLLGGGTEIGDNCYIWQGVITRSNIKICSNVIIGAGSLVLNDITKPGVYFGSPAKFVKEYDETLR
jgi:acetyltransferase-like isoleucine patch superfamily enzyme